MEFQSRDVNLPILCYLGWDGVVAPATTSLNFHRRGGEKGERSRGSFTPVPLDRLTLLPVQVHRNAGYHSNRYLDTKLRMEILQELLRYPIPNLAKFASIINFQMII